MSVSETNLQEPTDLLDVFRRNALANSVDVSQDLFALTSLLKIHANFLPMKCDFPYQDVIIVAQTFNGGCGSCFCYNEDPEILSTYLGKDARFIKTDSRCMRIAILDAVYNSFLCPPPDLSYRLHGNSEQKAKARASIMTSEVQRVFRHLNVSCPTVAVVGSVGNILLELAHCGLKVYATDLDTTLIGQRIGGVLVEDGTSMTLKRIEQSHVALVTGMTIATNTLDSILDVARKHGVTVVMFAETGGNFAGELVKMGVSCIIREEYPFYMFPGITDVHVYRDSDTNSENR